MSETKKLKFIQYLLNSCTNKVSIILLILSLNVFGYSQNTNSEWNTKRSNSCVPSILSVKIPPLGCLDFYTGMSLRVGVEYALRNNFTNYNEFGYVFPMTKNDKGWILKNELKKYFNPIENKVDYVSFEIMCKKLRYQTTDSIYVSEQFLIEKYQKKYIVSKEVASFVIKYGRIVELNSFIFLEGYFGLGLKLKNVNNNLGEKENIISSDDSYDINVLMNITARYTTVKLDFGFKIGFNICE